MQPGVLVVMGVCGVGKSTVGRIAAARLRWRYLEGDDFHPPENVEKMARGVPLDDRDWGPWLDRLHAELSAIRATGERAVLACSALKSSYRVRLRGAAADVKFLYLHGTRETIAARMASRTGHYMPPDLLDSQLAALEPPEDALWCGVDSAPEAIVDDALARLGLAPARTAW